MQYKGMSMHIESFRHKGLRLLYEDNNPKGVQASAADKLRKLLFAMETAENLTDLTVFPGWKLHPLKGTFAGNWSLTVSGNWRLIFEYNEATNTAILLDLIDYH
jgi:proteic killer suppression protein